MLFHPLLQILTLFCSIHISYKLDFPPWGFLLILKYLPVCSQKTQQTLPQEQFSKYLLVEERFYSGSGITHVLLD